MVPCALGLKKSEKSAVGGVKIVVPVVLLLILVVFWALWDPNVNINMLVGRACRVRLFFFTYVARPCFFSSCFLLFFVFCFGHSHVFCRTGWRALPVFPTYFFSVFLFFCFSCFCVFCVFCVF